MLEHDLKIVGIIGARSGSKGVPDKNIKPLAGKPLIGWIIGAAKKSKYLDRVIVSTDSEKYAEVARSFGAETPFLRPKEYAEDHSTDYDFVKHAVDWLETNEGYKPDIVVRLAATLPLQMPEDIDGCIEEILKNPEADTAIAIAEARQHPAKALKLVDDGKGSKRLVTYMTGSSRDTGPSNRQGYEKAYVRSHVVACKAHVIKDFGSLAGDHVKYHIIPQERSYDIDSEHDFDILEGIIKRAKLV